MTGGQLVVLPFLLLMLPTVAAAAWWLKRRYSNAIIRLQQEVAGVPAELDSAIAPDSPSFISPGMVRPLAVHILPARALVSGSHDPPGEFKARHLRVRVLALQFFSGFVYWCALWLIAAAAFTDAGGDVRQVFSVIAFIGSAPLLAVLTPPAIAWVLQAGVERRLLNIAAVLMLVIALVLLFSHEGWESLGGFVFGYAMIALLISGFLRPSIRGAGLPLTTAGIVGWIVLSGLFAIAIAVDPSEDPPSSVLELVLGVIVILLMLAVAGWFGWRAMMQLAARYQAKRFSDMQLALAIYWALLTAFMLGSLLRDRYLLLFSKGHLTAEWVCIFVIVLWLLWRWAQGVMLRRMVCGAGPSIGPLLFLRVFKPSRRSEEFADRFFAYWRFAAPVWMIAGPDLAGAYLQPMQFFAYLKGRLREHLIADPADVSSCVKALDNARDPDGRFRINELLCTNGTWQPAVLEMIAQAGVILLDLREYSQQRKGTRFELTELLRRAPLKRILLLIDAKDDTARLKAEVESIWREVAHHCADIDAPGELRVLQFSKGSNAEMHGLFRATVQAATS